MRLSTSTFFSVIFVLCAYAQGSGAKEPGSLLSGLPRIVSGNVLILDGKLKALDDAERWRLSVNDSMVFTSSAKHATTETAIRVALALRPGDNLVALELLAAPDESDQITRRWTTHVFRQVSKGGEQFAILAQGDSSGSDPARLAAFRTALIRSGIPSSHLFAANSAAELSNEIAELSAKTDVNDQVLIYYSGLGRVNKSNTEPLLIFSSSSSSTIGFMPASDLLHEAADLPAASVLLDIGYGSAPASNQVKPNIDPVSTRTNPQALPWLQTFNYSPNVDLAYTNPYGSTGSSQATELTQDFIAALASLDQHLKPCKTFSDIAQNVASANSRRNATWPVYFSQTSAPSSFCFSGGRTPSSPVSVTLTQVKFDPTLNFADVSATIPIESQASWADLLIDGVPVEHRSVLLDPNKPVSGEFSKRVPLSAGTHLIELKAGRGSSNAFTVGSAVANVPGNAITASETSDRLRAVILGPLSSESVTSRASLRIAFVVAELDGHPLEYEIRNNGALVLQDIVRNAPTLQHLEIVQQVPVGIGNNTITVEAKYGQLFSSKTTTVVRRPAQAVRAVLIGVDDPTGAPPLTGAVADARLMAKMVARYTDAVPGEVNLLTGSSATRQAIVNAIANSTVTHAADPGSNVDNSDEMLLLYFAGYGATFQDVNGQIVRCILPSDFDATHPVTSCIATTEIDRFLDSWDRSVVIFDTSYDGLAGDQGGSDRSRPTFSRTYKDLLTPDSGWRLSAGIDRPDRVFLVASGTNSAALESRDRSQGLFTWSFTRAIEEQVSVSGTGVQEVSLFDAFNRARNDTSDQSDRRQVPLMKGTLSSPFVFVDKAAGDLKREASAIDHSLRDDIASMRAPSRSELRRLSLLYDKILSIDPSDIEAPRGKVRTMLYGGEKGDLASAAEQVDNALNSFASQSESINRSEWLLLRSELKMRRGDLAGAITDAEEAVRLNGTSLRAAASLGGLYAASLQYEKAIPLLQGALERYANANDVSVTQEEWGQSVLLSYLCLRRTGHDGTAAVLLRSYSQSFAGNSSALHKLVVGNPLMKQLLPQTSHAVLMGDLGVEAPWSHLVSSFMVDPKKYEAQLQSFRADTAQYDLKDEKEFYCMLHFYLGIRRLFGRAPQQANIEFQSALKTDQTQYVEYWIAKAESNRLREQSTSGPNVPAVTQVASR